jgi:hypothetical protein
MEIQSAFNSGLQGFQKANEDASKAASDIAASTSYRAEVIQQSETAATPQLHTQAQPDLTQSIVDLKVAEYQAKGSVNVIKTADETLGTLLDVRV